MMSSLAATGRRRRKPRFTVQEWRSLYRFMAEIRADALRRKSDITHAASDVLDGWATMKQVAPLVREKLLAVRRGDECPACGCKRKDRGYCDCSVEFDTWELTAAGVRFFAPERAASLRARG